MQGRGVGIGLSERRYAAFWSLALLLQQFHTVILLDLTTSRHQLRPKETPKEKDVTIDPDEGLNSNAGVARDEPVNCTKQQLKDLTWTVTRVIQEDHHESVKNILEQMPNCDSSFEKHLEWFWNSQALFRPFYPVLSVLLYALAGCHTLAEQHLEEAEDELGCELMADALGILLDVLIDSKQDDGSRMETDSGHLGSCLPNEAQVLDDPNEQENLEIKMEILHKNLMNLGQLSNLMETYLEATLESDRKLLRASIRDFTTSMKETLTEEQAWAESHMNCLRLEDVDGNIDENSTISLVKKINISHIQNTKVVLHPPEVGLLNVNASKHTNAAQLLNTTFIRHRRSAQVRSRPVREVIARKYSGRFTIRKPEKPTSSIVLNASTLFFLRSVDDCHLLTSKESGEKLVSAEYSDSLLYNQLWLWTDSNILINKLHVENHVLISFDYELCNFNLGEGIPLGNQLENCIVTLDSDNNIHNMSSLYLKVVPFSVAEDLPQDVLCPVFIKTNSFPCLLLTETVDATVHVLPFDLDYPETQLWYWSNGRLINYYSGLALEAVPEDINNTSINIKVARPKVSEDRNYISQLWQTDGDNIQSKVRPDLYLNVDGDMNFRPSNTSVNRWSFLDALITENQVSVTECVEIFFVKVDGLPCKLLTAQGTELQMQSFNQSRVLEQLWFIRGGRLMNVASGLALAFKGAITNMSVKAELTSLNDFPDTQMWYLDKLISSQFNVDCLLYVDVIDHSIKVNCSANIHTPFYHWEWIEFGSGFESMEKIQCQYFIRSSHPACKVLTGFPETGATQFRHVKEQLLHLQMWHWEGNHLIHSSSGLYLTAQDIGTDVDIKLERFNLFKIQEWINNGPYITPLYGHGNTSTSIWQNVNKTNIFSKGNTSTIQKLELVKSSEMEMSENFLDCPNGNTSTSTFFIRNTMNPCLLLTGAAKGQSPTLRRYDSDGAQLWQWDDNYLVNVESGLVLHLSDSGEPVLSEMLMFEKAQMWSLERGILWQTFNNSNCLLTPAGLGEQFPGVTCSHTLTSKWEVVGVEKVWEDPEDVVCFFFIKNPQPPCEVVTGFSANETVKLHPVTDELIESQLWYWNGDRLVHAKTGLMLDMLDDTDQERKSNIILTNIRNETHNSVWHYDGNRLTTMRRGLTLNAENDGTVQVSNSDERWRLISKEDALKDPQILHCEVTINSTLYYIKNTAHPCKLLTAGHKGQSPYFLNFDGDIINLQLWYKDGSHVVNVGTNLALHLEPQENGSPSVILWDKYAFSSEQRWEEQGHVLTNMEAFDCVLTMDNNRTASCSPYNGLSQQNWTLVENDASLDEVVCFFFIRNRHQSCEYLTGYSEGSPALLRPIMDELLENQLWYWDGSCLTNVKTGLVLDQHEVSANLISLQRKRTENNDTQQWTFSGFTISLQSDPTLALDVNTVDNGNIEVQIKRNLLTQQWVILKLTEQPELLFCEPLPDIPDLFFLMSLASPCELLTASDKEELVRFKAFNGESYDMQLWLWQEGHLINHGSGLALQQGEPAVLWQVMAFSDRQRWEERGDTISSLKRPNCALESTTDFGSATVTLSCNITNQFMQWKMVPFYENMTNFDEIVCSYFIKNNLQPCDLLTGFDNGKPVGVSPWNPELNQLWYWEGQYLVNLETGLVLHKDINDRVTLSEKMLDAEQRWYINDKDSQHIQPVSTGLALELCDFTVSLQTKANRQSQYWTLISRKSGLDNRDVLTCEPKPPTVVHHLIKNEQDPCHLVTQVEGNQLSLQEFNENNVEHQLWFKHRSHILSASNYLAISAKTQMEDQNSLVSLEPMFSFALYQMWRIDGQLIQSFLRDHKLVLASHGNQFILQRENGQQSEKWTWLTLQDVKDDSKLVERCSRCYDKGEEKAAEIIGYIPFLSLFYNLIRSAVYAGKECNEVALESLLDATIDLALDVSMALVTAATAGTATSVMYGIKTAVKVGGKAGAKAGAKAIGQALKANVKLGIRSIKIGLKNVAKQGIKKSTKLSLKKTLKSVVTNVKAIKHLTINTAKGLKTVSIKTYHVSRKAIKGLKKLSKKTVIKPVTKKSFKKAASNLGKSIKARSKSFANKMAAIGNELASEAERKVKLLDEIKTKKSKVKVRCTRMLNSCIPKKEHMKPKKVADQEFVHEKLKLTSKSAPSWEDILREYEKMKPSELIGLEIKLKNEKKMMSSREQNLADIFSTIKNKEHKINQDVQHSYMYVLKRGNPKKSKLIAEYDLDKAGLTAEGLQKHTEAAITDQVRIKTKKSSFNPKEKDIYWYTKNSPCLTPSGPSSESCFYKILEVCKKWFENTPGKCYIGFEKYWGFNGKKWEELAKKINIQKSDHQINKEIFFKVLDTHRFIEDFPDFGKYASFVFLG